MTSDDRSFLNWLAMAMAVAALVLGFFALGRVGSSGEQAASAGGGSAVESSIIEMDLGALVFSPQHIMAPPGEVIIRVTNTDSQVHNISVMGVKSRDLQPGESEDLSLGVLDVGVYPMLCEISGHADAGMTGNLHVIMNAEPGAYTGTDGGESAGGDRDHLHGFSSWEEMQTAMDDRAMRFITEEKGEFGGRPMEWTMSDDGYKVFEVTAMLVDWEVEPGKVVEAYTYNGTVPAPEIRAEVGDKIRVILKNELPTPTTIHWHGIRVPNSMDGVPPYTQEATPPGEEFVYEFEALEPAVGIYHPHNGASQVLDGMFGAVTIGQMQTPDVLLDQGFKATPDQEIQMVLNDAGVIGLSL
ncbi:MAG: multicopper oxidase domain-containing protein, partial [Acidimicrobiia bacterium]